MSALTLVATNSAQKPCAHCGLPVSTTNDDKQSVFCCSGCASVYQILHQSGLAGFYKIRESSGVSSQPAVPETREHYAWADTDAFRDTFVTESVGISEVSIAIDGLHCTACVWLIERLPRLHPGWVSARVNMSRRHLTLRWVESETKLSAILRRLAQCGYRARPARGYTAEREQLWAQRLVMIRIGVAGAAFGNAMLLAFSLYAGAFQGMAPEWVQLFRIASMAVVVPAVVFSGFPFFRGGWHALRTRTPHMDLPIAIGIFAGLGAGVFNTIRGDGDIFFDSIAALVFFLLIGRWLTERGERRAMDLSELLWAFTPQHAKKVCDDGVVEVAASSLQPDDTIEVRAGDSVPADGVIIEGSGHFERAFLTGESRPIGAECGDTIEAGARCIEGTVRISVKTAGGDTRLGRLFSLVQEAQDDKPALLQATDRLAGIFVVTVVGLALAVGLGTGLTLGIDSAVHRAIAVLIVACPCALGLAAPLAVHAAQTAAARAGIWVKRSSLFERLASIGAIVFDKTGTITQGTPKVCSWIGEANAKGLVASLEAQATHPIGQALATGLDVAPTSLPHPEHVRVIPGEGIAGDFAEGRLWVGNAALMRRAGATQPAWVEKRAEAWLGHEWTPVYVALEGKVIGAAAVGDALRPDSHDALDALNRYGLKSSMLSGDHPEIVASVARAVGNPFTSAQGDATPETKWTSVRDAQAQGERVLMVGDGINDAAALGAAHVGVAVHGGAEASMQVADAYLSQPGIGGIVTLYRIARRTRRVILTNIGLSLVYNACGITLAALGYLPPWAAAILMPVSSLTVIANSWWSLRGEPK